MKNQGATNGRARLSSVEVLAIRALYLHQTAAQIAAVYPVTINAVFSIVNGKTWRHLPLRDYSGRSVAGRPMPARTAAQRVAASVAQRGKCRRARLTAADVLGIRAKYHTLSLVKVARLFDTNQTTIYNIVSGKTWPELPVETYIKLFT